MFAARQSFVLLLIAGLCLDAYGTPVEQQQEETVHELPTVGYFQDDMDVDFQRPNDTVEASNVEQQEETDPELSPGYFQGDMIVEFDRNGLISPTYHWPNGIVHYKIDKGFNTEYTEIIKRAMRRIAQVSCIRFVRAKPTTSEYVQINVSNGGCSAHIGYKQRKQNINLNPFRCLLGNIMHEMLHTLGFHHQHCSSDRDNYVKIIWKNIRDSRKNNFKKYGAHVVDNFGAAYDYGSIMHYPYNGFSKDGSPTIVALQPSGQSQMGQRRRLSNADIIRLNNMYECTSQLQMNNNGTH